LVVVALRLHFTLVTFLFGHFISVGLILQLCSHVVTLFTFVPFTLVTFTFCSFVGLIVGPSWLRLRYVLHFVLVVTFVYAYLFLRFVGFYTHTLPTHTLHILVTFYSSHIAFTVVGSHV